MYYQYIDNNSTFFYFNKRLNNNFTCLAIIVLFYKYFLENFKKLIYAENKHNTWYYNNYSQNHNQIKNDKILHIRVIFRGITFFTSNIKIAIRKITIYNFYCKNLVCSQNVMIKAIYSTHQCLIYLNFIVLYNIFYNMLNYFLKDRVVGDND